MKVAFLFPSQASWPNHPVGNLYQAHGFILKRALKKLGGLLSKRNKIISVGSDLYAQLKTYALSISIAEYLIEEGIVPHTVASFSSGLYASLVIARSSSFANGLEMVYQAGILLEKSNPSNKLGMGVVIGLKEPEIKSLLNKYSLTDSLFISIRNNAHQIILSGPRNLLWKFLKYCKEEGALDAYPLPPQNAYHSPYVKEAARDFSGFLNGVTIVSPIIPVVEYHTGKFLSNTRDIKSALWQLLYSSVNWPLVVHSLKDKGFNTLIEIGPGDLLSRATRWISRDLTILSTSNDQHILNTLQFFKESRCLSVS